MQTYGGIQRHIKKNEYRSLNRRDPHMVHATGLILFMVGVLVAGVLGFYVLDRFEAQFRPVQVAQR